jgi:hypothetical protein
MHTHPFLLLFSLLLRADKAQSKDSLSLFFFLSLSLSRSLSLSLFSFCLPVNQHVKSEGGGLGQRMGLRRSGIAQQIEGKYY